MIEILDETGRIIGLLDPREMRTTEQRHGWHTKVTLIRAMDWRRLTTDPDGLLTIDEVVLRWHEVEVMPGRHSRTPGHRRWYLVAASELPEHVWHARGFTDLRPGFKDLAR